MTLAPYILQMPDIWQSYLVFSSPHSGRFYPKELLQNSILDESDLRSLEDAYVEQILSHVPSLGGPLLQANYARAWLDLNRSRNELDPALIAGLAKRRLNARVLLGLGVVPRVAAGGKSIYHGKLSLQEAERRIGEVWEPYHQKLDQLCTGALKKKGMSVLIDCHSMPSKRAGGRAPAPLPDIVIGTLNGVSCSRAIAQACESAFTKLGFDVVQNKPFAGAYILERHGRPQKQRHALQIEINRALYMDESNFKMLDGFHAFQARLDQAFRDFSNILEHPDFKPSLF